MKKLIFNCLLLFICPFIVLEAQVPVREHYVDEPTFQATLSGILDGNVMGYQYALGDENGAFLDGFQGLTKSAFDNGGTASSWTAESQMMAASIAKIVCAVAILNILENTIIVGAPTQDDKLDLLLKDYLPIRWQTLINGNEDQISLRHLMTHQSGFTSSASNPLTGLNETVAVAIPNTFFYANVNYNLAGFMSVIMGSSTAMANLEVQLEDTTDQGYNDVMIDEIRTAYQDYVLEHIFQPAGFTATCGVDITDPNDSEVFQYGPPLDTLGNGVMSIATCMSNGWLLSAENMVDFMQQWSNPHLPGNILETESVALINDFPNNAQTSPLGWIWNRDTHGGQIEGYGHNGIWTMIPSGLGSNTYTSAVVLTEDNMYMSINVNSGSITPNPLNRGVDLITAYNASVCASDITLDSNNIRKYNSAINTIQTQSSTLVNAGDTKVFKAGESIILNPGFTAVSGSVFKSYIDICDNLPTVDP